MRFPPAATSAHGPGRRTILRGLGGAAALGAGIPLLGACGGSASGSSDPNTVILGSGASDAVPKKAFADVYAEFTQRSGIKVKVNTKDHNTFQEQINSYLQGTPDDVFGWFAGYRMQFFAAKGLSTPIDGIWKKIGGNFPAAMHELSKGADGKYHFVPMYTYPWAAFYRKSVFQKYGYEVPATWSAFIALCKQMKKDGLVPIAFGDKDKWPAIGTFDQINVRINGYDFHMSQMRGEAAWTDARTRAVFDNWTEILPYHLTIIESLRAFDLVFVFNGGTVGTELLSILVTDNIIGESSRIGYSSAIAVVLLVISLAVIVPYLASTFRKERRS
ncbi:extracellular solute-binding protein [Streptomyces sp. NPDC097727]|uniref:extracellular solute-binding protein n=1 Tax=Streptomyces sp. NPDC097727 TaxID=3366092 RepID=UPI0038109723